MSGTLDSLERLAQLAGIQPAFQDYFGNEVRVGPQTKRALLAAMGYDLESGASVTAALRQLQDESRSSALPPVLVCRAAAPLHVACTLTNEAVSVSWEIDLESGGTLRGSTSWNDAETIDLHAEGATTVCRRRVTIDARPPLGYHTLTIRANGSAASCPLAIVPHACYLPPEMERGRVWALATQLYALRSRGDWGIGSFTSLSRLARSTAAAAGAAIGLNPLHELHPANPAACSPYAPSSRLFLNALYVDVPAVPDLAESLEAQAFVARPCFVEALRSLEAQALVDYAGVAAAKHGALELLFASFCARHLERPGDARATAFRRFVRNGGTALERLALYEAIDERFRAGSVPRYGWQQWPLEYRSPETPDVRRFAYANRARLDYYRYLQWLAEEQLAGAARDAGRCGVGLYRDLAVGVDLDGADAWSDQRTICAGASLGAPPDPLNQEGQNWGLPPFSPRELRRLAYEPLRELLRANMRHASVLRIDHVMALRRAFWVPRGCGAAAGAYVSYELEELLGIVALESVRNRCAVVGEDLGTVPEGFRERLHEARALSSRLIYFERAWDGTFLPPQSYPRLAAASIGTHDLPPLAGWWLGEDSAAGDGRHGARFALIDALERTGSIDAPCAQRMRTDAEAGGTLAVVRELSEAVHRFLAATPSVLAVVALENVLEETDAVNVPGTVDEHPNWRRRHSVALEDLEKDGRLFRIGSIMCDTQEAMREARR